MITGEMIKEKREQIGMSQADLARRLDLTQTIVSRIERGKRQIAGEERDKLSQFLEIEIAEEESEENIGEVIKAKRLAKGWSQRYLGKVSGVSSTYIGDIETGRSKPKRRTVVNKILKALDSESQENDTIVEVLPTGEWVKPTENDVEPTNKNGQPVEKTKKPKRSPFKGLVIPADLLNYAMANNLSLGEVTVMMDVVEIVKAQTINWKALHNILYPGD
jgi:transcriptional regulator with XRE-family HTH domain